MFVDLVELPCNRDSGLEGRVLVYAAELFCHSELVALVLGDRPLCSVILRFQHCQLFHTPLFGRVLRDARCVSGMQGCRLHVHLPVVVVYLAFYVWPSDRLPFHLQHPVFHNLIDLFRELA